MSYRNVVFHRVNRTVDEKIERNSERMFSEGGFSEYSYFPFILDQLFHFLHRCSLFETLCFPAPFSILWFAFTILRENVCMYVYVYIFIVRSLWKTYQLVLECDCYRNVRRNSSIRMYFKVVGHLPFRRNGHT